MSIIERILQIAEYKQLSVNKFSQILGVSNAYFSKQKKNNANVGSHIIEKIVSIYPEINLQWLITGNGEMLKQGSNIQTNKGNGANIIQNGNGNISGTINIGGEMHSKKSIEERLKGMEHEIRNLRTQVDNLNKIIEEKERLIETKDQIIELLKNSK